MVAHISVCLAEALADAGHVAQRHRLTLAARDHYGFQIGGGVEGRAHAHAPG